MSPEDKELLSRVDEILYYIWDPIGVAPDPWARDEYSSYALQVVGQLVHNESLESIADYLSNTMVKNIGLDDAPQHNREVAELLIQCKKKIYNL